MKKYIYTLGLICVLVACDKKSQKEPSYPFEPVEQVKKESIEQLAKKLEADGYKTFIYKEGDSTYLMQQYFMVFLKSGENRNQDSTEAAQLQLKHLAHLERMAVEGYASLIGPFEDDGDVRGIVVYNTRTLKEADSLANMDPMVKAGRLKVEVHPWWTAKGGKLK